MPAKGNKYLVYFLHILLRAVLFLPPKEYSIILFITRNTHIHKNNNVIKGKEI